MKDLKPGRKSFLATPFEVKDVEAKEGSVTFSGLASTYDVDLGNDRIEPGAFGKTLAEAQTKRRARATKNRTLFPLFRDHDSKMVVGSVIEAEETRSGLQIVGKINTNTVLGRETATLLEDDDSPIGKMSIGYWPIKKDFDGEVRVLKEVMLGEVSLVAIPMNPGAIVDGKSLAFDHIDEMDLREMEAALREGHPMSKSLAKAVAGMLFKRREDAIDTARREASEGKKSNPDAAKYLLEGLGKLNP